MITRSAYAEVNRVHLLDVASWLGIELNRRGRGRCPAGHGGKGAKTHFSITWEGNFARCWHDGCAFHRGGGAVGLTMFVLHYDYRTAIVALMDRFGQGSVNTEAYKKKRKPYVPSKAAQQRKAEAQDKKLTWAQWEIGNELLCLENEWRNKAYTVGLVTDAEIYRWRQIYDTLLDELDMNLTEGIAKIEREYGS